MESTLGTIKQAGAVPFEAGGIWLVTSTSRKAWVIPKGCQEPGQTESETARQEAWEEAGLEGTLSPDPLGSYSYNKWGKICSVRVFLMDVTKVAVDWPERSARDRRRVAPAEALRLIDDEGLSDLIRKALALRKVAID